MTVNQPTDLDQIAAPRPVASQATAIEQSRAVAEVHAMVVVAQQMPRSVPAAIAALRESCSQKELAERAFYRFPRSGQTVSGPSVHLARELARIWGNVTYGIHELRRDDLAGESEMQAWAWDVQTNTRTSRTFINKHERDTKRGRQKLTDLRDIYESNTNQGSRAVREAIFAILPPWFVDQAKELCMEALRTGGGKPLGQRVADAVKAFEGIGVKVDRLEDRLGSPREKWDEQDVAQLVVTYQAISRGEVRKEDEFPPPDRRVSPEELIGT